VHCAWLHIARRPEGLGSLPSAYEFSFFEFVFLSLFYFLFVFFSSTVVALGVQLALLFELRS